jgi:hypothetical protein
MHLPKFVRRGVGPMVLVLGVAVCASIGPAVVPQDRVGYVSSIADSWKEQTLLNVVRLRYGDAPTFLDIASVVNSYAIQGQLSAGGVINSNLTNLAPWSTATLGAGLSYQDRPTISFAPLTGDKFTRSLLRPIPPVRIFQLVQAGYPADFVLHVTVRALNGISIRRSVGDEGQRADPEFYPLLEALRRLQLDETVSLRLEKRGTEDVGVLVLASSRTPQVNQDLKFVTDTLHLKPGKDGQVSIVFAAVQSNDKELAVLSRSMFEILLELASGIDVPAEHVAGERTMPSERLANAENPRDRPLVRVLSGPAAPRSATETPGTGSMMAISPQNASSRCR